MSWSIYLTNTTSKVIDGLYEHSEKLSGQSKIEFDDALPHLVALVRENFDDSAKEAAVRLEASGHGTAVDGLQKTRTMQVNMHRHFG